MRATITALIACAALSGCSLLFPEDPRLGEESVEECEARVAELLIPGTSYRTYEGNVGVPTYTYDVTKLSLEAMQALIVEGSDETAGARGIAATNQAQTAVDNFMAQSVDENGAFFLGREPALYRVRGERQAKESMIASGCERQQPDMRLIMVDIAASAAPSPDNADNNENNN